MEYVMIASAIVGAASAVQSGRVQQRQARAQAQADQYNAIEARNRADQILKASNQREEQQRRVNRVMAGKRRAFIATSGTGLGGSNADMDAQAEAMAELDALNIRYEGQLEARGMLNQSNIDDMRASSASQNARDAGTGTWLNTAGALLSGASNYYTRTNQQTGGR